MVTACSKQQRTELEETSGDDLVQCPYLTKVTYERLSRTRFLLDLNSPRMEISQSLWETSDPS